MSDPSGAVDGARPVIVTPSYLPDLALCEALCRSVDRFLPDCSHQVLVDRRDFPNFRHLAASHRTVVVKEDVLPRGIRQVPSTNRWLSRWSIRPLRGWLIQQLVKLGVAESIGQNPMILIDSDTFLIRPVDPRDIAPAGGVRMYAAEAAITASMHDHVGWYRAAFELLGLGEPGPPPYPDYISSFVTWDPALVRKMLARLEAINSRPWMQVLIANPHVSEFLLYGVYVDRIAGRDSVSADLDDRCLTYWEFVPLDMAAADTVARGVRPTDLAALVSSHSHTPTPVLEHLRSVLSGGALH